MKKYLKYIAAGIAVATLAPLSACNDDDVVDPYDINYCYVYQPNTTFASLEYKHNGDFLIDVKDPLKLMPVRSTKPVKRNTEVIVSIEQSLVDMYNAEKGTDYVFLEGAKLLTPTLTIDAGKYMSADSITVSFDHSKFQDGNSNYILPVAITSAYDLTVSKSSVIYLTFTSSYRANLISTTSQKNLTIVNDTDVEGWETANTDYTIDNFITSTWPADEAVDVKLTVDPELIAAYNEANGTEFKAISAQLPASITIAAGQSSANLSLKLGNYSGVANGEKYLIPVKLEITNDCGAELTPSSNVAYIQIRDLPLELTVSTEAPAYAQITPMNTWTLTCEWAYPDDNPSQILINNENYQYAESGEKWTVDFGDTNELKAFGFQFYAWYYAMNGITNVETSADGNVWTSWGDVNFEYTSDYQYLTFSKTAKCRYLRFNTGAPLYDDYGTFVRQITFFN